MEERAEYNLAEGTGEHRNPQIQEKLARLCHGQLRYVVARLRTSSKKAAVEEVHIPYETVTHWPAYVDETVSLLLLDTVASARALLVRDVAQAMAVKLAGLESTDEKIRQRAASEVVEWNLGRAAQSLGVIHGVTDDVRKFMRELVEQRSRVDLAGQRFGRLVVIEGAGSNSRGMALWSTILA